MKRQDRVIALIEELRGQHPSDQRRDRVEQLIESINNERRVGFIGKVLIGFVIVVCLYPSMLLFSGNPRHSFVINMPIWAVYLWSVGGLYVVAWGAVRLPKRLNLQSVQIHPACHQCEYSLDGHESVLGDDIWVGPEICPECGERYPAIG